MYQIKENISKLLKDRNLSFPILANKIGKSYQNLNIQLNREFPNLELLYKIADALNVPISELLQPATTNEKRPAIICPHCGKQITIIASKPEK